MRTFTIILIVVTLIVAGAAIYLVATIPRISEPVRFPLSAKHQALLARVPASADSYALVPTAAVLYTKLMANPVTRESAEEWTRRQPMPSPWMLGAADLVLWREGKELRYALRMDPFRAWLAKVFGAIDDSMLVRETAPASSLPVELRFASGGPSDLLVVQRLESRAAFPPIGRPAVSLVQVTPTEILLTSRANTDDVAPQRAIRGRFPQHAMLAVTFADPPRLLGDLNRILGTDLTALTGDGGSIALYDVDAGTLLPRPKGVISLPANEKSRAALKNLTRIAEVLGDSRDTGQELLVSFDHTSLQQYSMDTMVPATWPATRWGVRMNPATLVPMLRRLGDNHGLRFTSPRIYRAARDLRKWIDALENAESVEAADSVAGGVEELRVRVASK